MGERSVVVIGGGQAGLATSYELTSRGVEHVVLERGHVGQTWRDRWDSFCLVTPNWSVQLPGAVYDGDEPDGYMPRDELVAYLEAWATRFGAPVLEGVEVTSIAKPDGSFVVETSADEIRADDVVLATGAYQRAYLPPGAATLPEGLLAIDVTSYTNEATLPAGAVLVVGSGQTGCQLAEEFHQAGREVFLSCGRAPWVARRIHGRDVVWWAVESGFLDQSVEALPEPSARLWANLQATGHGGGHDLNVRVLRDQGVTLVGRFLGAEGGRVRFAGDLGESVAWGDQANQQFMGLVRKTAAELAMEAPDTPPPPPFDAAAPGEVDVARFGAVVFTGGFRPDYRSWLPWDDAFDDIGFPIHHEGSSTVVPGLHFVGVHFLRKRKSSLLCGVGEDAAILADTIATGR